MDAPENLRLRFRHLPPEVAPEHWRFVLSGLVPNRKGHSLLNEWIGVAYRSERFVGLVPFPELLQRIGIGKRPSPIEARRWTRKFCAACCRTP